MCDKVHLKMTTIEFYLNSLMIGDVTQKNKSNKKLHSLHSPKHFFKPL